MNAQRFANPLFIALDTPDLGQALELSKAVRPYVGGLKVGLEFISAHGPAGMREIAALGLPVFADVKFHDIPNTVAGAAREMAALGVAMFNVHASGGADMMRAAKEAAAPVDPKVQVIAVTVLTSVADQDLRTIGQGDSVALQVERLARLAREAGLDGVVCSPREIEVVRRACGSEFLIVTPGVRPAGAALADQRRVTTPLEAVRAGADILVIGRPITAAADPVAAARAIAEEVAPARAA
ncbi:MAG TPA: orotidine-5'-phosphate decarboxylase [Rhizomicrobium sp.]|nr:orotidine-5'-phosphate decarboxylase [Rhizomicrobium sp.]